MRIDVHQHLLSEQLIDELARRRQPPMLVRRSDGWTFRLDGEPDSVLSLAATDVERRGEELGSDGVDRALIALSTALGIETLPAEEALPLLEAHHLGIEDLPEHFGGWGAVQLEAPDPAEVDAAIARGCVGLSLPAGALASPTHSSASGRCSPGSSPTTRRCSSIPARSFSMARAPLPRFPPGGPP